MDPAIPLDEDCLYLNIWTPALRGSGADARLTGEPLPVMVWIHGGAYQCGCAMEKEFDGTALARQGVGSGGVSVAQASPSLGVEG